MGHDYKRGLSMGQDQADWEKGKKEGTAGYI
jgi:hypothetical protein